MLFYLVTAFWVMVWVGLITFFFYTLLKEIGRLGIRKWARVYLGIGG
jgi:hypothetical protein